MKQRSCLLDVGVLCKVFVLSVVLALALVSPAFAQLLPESTLSIDDVTLTEGDTGTTNATFTVTRSGDTSLISTVNFATADDSATQPGDYGPISGTLTFAAGETTQTVTVSVNGDTLDEVDEKFLVNLSAAVEATISDDRGVGTIIDDDYTPQANDDGSAENPITLTEDDPNGVTTNVLANDTGLGDAPITVTATNGGKGTVTVNPDNTVTYKPNANENGFDNYEYTVTDSDGQTSTATVYLHIIPVNDAPSFTKGADETKNEDDGAQSVPWATAILSGPSNESGQAVDFIVSNDNSSLFTSGGQPQISANGTLSYTSAPDANGTAGVSVKLHDDGGTVNGGVDTSGVQIFTITINAVNDAPVADGQSDTTNEDTAKEITLGASDFDSNDLSYSIVGSGPAHGTLSGTGATRTYTPDANYNGPDSFTYTANDGTADSNAATVNVTINPVNDAPTVSNIADKTVEKSANTGSISFTVGDLDSAADSLTVTGSSSNTTLVPDANIVFGGTGAERTVKVTPAAGKIGTATITVRVSDGSAQVSETFVLTVQDTIAPTLIAKSPKPKSTAVSPQANVVASFSEAMMRRSLTKSTVTLVKTGTTRKVAASLSYPAPNKVVLNPSTSLVRGATYKVTIVGGASGVKDLLAGNPLRVSMSWSFKIRA